METTEAVVQGCSVKKRVFWGVLVPDVCNFIKKETLGEVFSCEFCKIFKNFFKEHLWWLLLKQARPKQWAVDSWQYGTVDS